MAFKFAFRVKHDSEFYRQYFDAKEERTHFRTMAVDFFKKHGIDGRYYQSRRLGVKLDHAQREKLVEHLVKNPDKYGFFWFKKKSPIAVEWGETVVANTDFPRMEQCDFWWASFIMRGKYNLWDYDGEIYGYLEDYYEKDITLGDYMIPIKISEYYAVIEDIEERSKKE